MESFKKYVTCEIAFFIPVTCLTLFFLKFTLSPLLCYSLKINNGMKEKNTFCIYVSFSVARYIKEGRKSCL